MKNSTEAVFQLQACDEGGSCFIINHRGDKYLFDCWLEKQYHSVHQTFYLGKRANPVWIDVADLPKLNGLFLSSVQNDHANSATLKKIQLNYPNIPIWANTSLRGKLTKNGFLSTHIIKPGAAFTIGKNLRVIQLKGYGGCYPFLYQDIPSQQTLCIAPHSIHFPWLKAHLQLIKHLLKLNNQQKLVTTLCLGITPTFLKPLGRLAKIMPDRGINIPLPEQSLQLLNLLEPTTILPIHQTPEIRSGWATKHLVQFPWAPKRERNNSSLNIGSMAAQEWLRQQYHSGVFITPQPKLICC